MSRLAARLHCSAKKAATDPGVAGGALDMASCGEDRQIATIRDPCRGRQAGLDERSCAAMLVARDDIDAGFGDGG